MTSRSLTRFACLAVASVGASAHAQSQDFIFDFRSDMVCATGRISGLMNSDGWVSILDGELEVIAGAHAGRYDLIDNPGGTSASISPAGYFIYDNQLAPGEPSSLNTYGLLFGAGGTEINIWGNGANNPYTFYARNGSAILSSDGGFTIASIPEPAGVELAGLGLGAACAVRRRVSRQQPRSKSSTYAS
ncbi:MAG: hypothetical protein HEQ23_02870 [Tepidisphaera sp.]